MDDSIPLVILAWQAREEEAPIHAVAAKRVWAICGWVWVHELRDPTHVGCYVIRSSIRRAPDHASGQKLCPKVLEVMTGGRKLSGGAFNQFGWKPALAVDVDFHAQPFEEIGVAAGGQVGGQPG